MIAAVAMAIVLFILVFIICAVCMKKKKTEEKLKPFTVTTFIMDTYIQHRDTTRLLLNRLKTKGLEKCPCYRHAW